jgi:hypothetical protein
MSKKLWICILLACFANSIALGQTSFGSIVGTVTDSTGAVIPNVQLALTNLATNTRLTTVSNQAGIYALLNVPPGVYRMEAEQSAFKHFIRQPIEVQVQQTYQVDIQMTVGAVTETLEVTAEVALLQPQTSSLGQVVTGRTVAEMPLNGRNVYNLMELVPAVIPQGTAGGTSVGMYSASLNNYQISGAFAGQSAVSLDGQSVNSGFWNYASLIPTQDSVAEFKVQTNNLGPELGPLRRRRHDTDHQIGNEPDSRVGLRVSSQQGPQRQHVLQQPGRNQAAALHAEPVRRICRRPCLHPSYLRWTQ